MWLWRRMLRVCWVEKKTNACVRQQVDVSEEKGLLTQLKRQQYQHTDTGKDEAKVLF